MSEHILTMGRGKNKRQWSLDDKELKEFELRFEENELVELPDNMSVEEYAKTFKLIKVDF